MFSELWAAVTGGDPDQGQDHWIKADVPSSALPVGSYCRCQPQQAWIPHQGEGYGAGEHQPCQCPPRSLPGGHTGH